MTRLLLNVNALAAPKVALVGKSQRPGYCVESPCNLPVTCRASSSSVPPVLKRNSLSPLTGVKPSCAAVSARNAPELRVPESA